MRYSIPAPRSNWLLIAQQQWFHTLVAYIFRLMPSRFAPRSALGIFLVLVYLLQPRLFFSAYIKTQFDQKAWMNFLFCLFTKIFCRCFFPFVLTRTKKKLNDRLPKQIWVSNSLNFRRLNFLCKLGCDFIRKHNF